MQRSPEAAHNDSAMLVAVAIIVAVTAAIGGLMYAAWWFGSYIVEWGR